MQNLSPRCYIASFTNIIVAILSIAELFIKGKTVRI
jgi:hypothetical protein